MRMEKVALVPNPVNARARFVVSVSLPINQYVSKFTNAQLKSYKNEDMIVAHTNAQLKSKRNVELARQRHCEIRRFGGE